MAEPSSPQASDVAIAEASVASKNSDPFEHTRAVAEYVSDMIGQLESMSRLAGFDLLAYLLSMARVEAETNARIARR